MEMLKRFKEEIANKIVYENYQQFKIKFQDLINVSKTIINLGILTVK